MQAPATPAPQLVLFARGVIAALNAWPVLRLAVQESWGGPQSAQKRTWIASTLVDAFESEPLDEEQIEDLLLDSMAEEFETEIEDGSSQLVARDVLNIWRAACNGDTEAVLKLEAEADRLSRTQLPPTRQLGNGDDGWEDEGGDGDDEDGQNSQTPPLSSSQTLEPAAPTIDEEGFQLVQKHSKKKDH